MAVEPPVENRRGEGVFAGAVCRGANPTSRICSIRFSDTEVTGHMTPNWAASVVWVLVLAFFVVVGLGIALGVYAAGQLKKAEGALAPAPIAEPEEA